MCKKWIPPKPCRNYECSHNLFWEGLNLNPRKIHETDKALKIANCFCFLNEPWTIRDIEEAWGLTSKSIKHCEEVAWRKVQKKSPAESSPIRMIPLTGMISFKRPIAPR